VAAQLITGWWRSMPAARRVRAPVVVAGAVTCVAVGIAAPFGAGAVDGEAGPIAVVLAWGAGFAVIPLAVLGAVLRQRTARVALSELLRALERAPAGLPMRDALAATLGDPTLEVVQRTPDGRGWRTADGAPARMRGGARAVTPLGGPGARTGVLHDAALLEEPGLLDTVSRGASLALEHAEMRRQLRERLDEARAVRARIVAASDEARRRIERDLHDGAQQSLVSLVLALAVLDEELADSGDELALRLVRHATEQADRALDELRDLARGVFPALLVNDGLEAGLRELARRCPLPVGLELDLPARPEPAVEAAGWFLVREALGDAVARGAGRASVRAVLRDGVLALEVTDDGAGGARPGPEPGSCN
jgi:signal transduction histidine kinase